MSSELPVIDMDIALERAGGNADLARDLYQMLQKELPGYLENLPDLFADNDLTSLTASVHKLHGSATYCGVPALKEATEAFESCLKRREAEHYQEGMDAVMDAIQRLLLHPKLPNS